MLKKIIHSLIIASLVFMFVFITISLFKPSILEWIVDWIKIQIESLGNWNYLLAFISALLESLPIIGTIVPGQVVLMSVGGFYGSTGLQQFIWIMIAAISGSVISNGVGYILGKHYGEGFFKTYGMWVGIQETELKYMKKSVNTWGPGGIILSKFHQHFRAFMPFIAGSMGLLSKKFWIYNAIASILWAATFVGVWIFFAEYYKEIIKYIQYIIFGCMVAFGIYIWKFKKEAFLKYISEKNKEIEKKYQ